jgi:hypothetical protein
VTANALHAIVAADADVPAGLAAAVAAVPPVVLLASTHLTVVLIRTTTQPAAEAAAVRKSVALEVAPTELHAVASPAPELARSVPVEKIARSLDVHPSTVGRWFPGAHHPDEPEQPRAVLEGATP